MDSVFGLFNHVGIIGVITFGFGILNSLLTLPFAVITIPFRNNLSAVVAILVFKNAFTMYIYGGLVALATIAYLGATAGPFTTFGAIVLGLLTIVAIIGNDMYSRRKQALDDGYTDPFGITRRVSAYEPWLLLFALVVFVASVLVPAVALPALLRPVLAAIIWLVSLPIISIVTGFVGFGFTVFVIFYGLFIVAMLIGLALGKVRM